MDLVQELLLTVLFAAVFSFIITKLVSAATSATGGVSQSREIAGADIVVSAQRREIEIERRVQVCEGAIKKVDKFSGEKDSAEEAESDLVGRTECDVAVENAMDRVSEERIVELLMVDDEIVKDFGSDDDIAEIPWAVGENTENIGVDEDIREIYGTSEPVIGGGKLDEFDDVDEENAVAGVLDKKIVEDSGGNHVSLECSGAIGMNNEEIGVEGDIGQVSVSSYPVMVDDSDKENASEDKFAEHLLLDDKIAKDVGCDGDSFKNTVAICEDLEKLEGEVEIKGNLGTSRERNLDEVHDVAVVYEVKVVEYGGPVDEVFGSSGVNDEIFKSIGTDDDLAVSLRTNDPLLNEVVVQEEIEGKKFEEKIVEREGVDSDRIQNPEANVASSESVGDVGDISVNLRTIGDEKMKGFIDDDWEGIERSELEESFAAAANYADKNVSKFDSDVKMEFYGLNKVAFEGPCREPQPMAIKVSARAKWNAWQRLGDMSPEVAMEQYISLLSDKAPKWKEGKSSGDGSKVTSKVTETSPPDMGTYPENQLDPIKESRELEVNSTTDKVT